MNKIQKEIIKKRIDKIRNSKKKIFFKGYKKYDYFKFKKKLNSVNFVLKCIDQLSNGYIFILQNSIKANFIENAKIKLNKILKKRHPIKPKIITGIKNGYYISNNMSSKGYKTYDTSFYFFSWNKDKTGIYKKIIEIYKPLKILNGLNKQEITNNKPIDGIVERVHVINYPTNSGQISRHYDPINVSIFNFGIYATQYGEDYSSGGFFVLDKDKLKKNIDKKINKTDIVLFFPSLIHGVDIVKSKNPESTDGRWFINVNHTQSHEVFNREYTKKY